jgi:hypothetical protein
MPDGEMRRPPQLWEQRLARTTSVLGVGLSSSGDATAIVSPTPPPGAGGGVEPAPVLPPPGDFIKPSTPQLIGAVQGISVLWDGLNSAGDLWPYDTSWVEVHMSTAGTGFTPGTATLRGRLARPGALYVGGLTAGTTYHFRLQGVNPAGGTTEPSDAASGLTGLTTASDYGTATIGSGAVSFNARQIGGVTNTVGSTAPTSPLLNDVWLDSSPGTAIVHKIWNGSTWVTNAWGSASIAAGQITALQIATGAVTAGAISAGAITAEKIDAGAITADKIAALTITGDKIAGNTISADKISAAFITATDVGSGGSTVIDGGRITSGTITGRVVQSSSGSARIVLNNADTLDFFSGGVKRGDFYGVTVSGLDGIGVTGALDVSSTVFCPDLEVSDDAKVTGDIEVDGALTDTSTSVPNLRINTTTGVIKQTTHANSAQRFKHDIIPLDDTAFGGAIDPSKLGNPDDQAVDPYDILDVTPIQYRRNEAPTVIVTGFLAEDVEQKFPTAATYDDDGLLETIDERAIVAALLAVVKQQQTEMNDLRARIEALEAP